MTSEKNIGEKTESSSFERGYNMLGFVGPVIQDLGYRFSLNEINLVESYRKSDLYLVVKATTSGKGTKFDLVFNAVPGRIDEQLPDSASGGNVPKLGREVDAEKSMLICDGHPVEGPENIISSFVRLERSKDRKQFLWNIFAPAAHIVLEFDGAAPEGEVGMQWILIPARGGCDSETSIVQRGSDLVDCLPGFIDQVVRDFVLKSDPVDFVSRVIRVGIAEHLVWANLQERTHLSYKILDVQLCTD
ncbi:MAG: hypothetical protein WBE37_13950 [Bryobacteraceae bacterium]